MTTGFIVLLNIEGRGGMKRIYDIEAIQNRFMEFKKYVTRGSLTIEQLEDRVYGNYGTFFNKDKASRGVVDINACVDLFRGYDEEAARDFLRALNEIQEGEDEKREES